jgi:flavin-dependent dehydrogenase
VGAPTDQVDVDVVVVGGGPAGSTTASFLQTMGHRVLVLERERFPRHHIGESMIAATIDVLEELGLGEKLAEADFPIKSGGCFIWGETHEPWCIRFEEVAGRPTSYQVKRDVFDTILLDHSAELGVDVRQEHRVTDVVMDGDRVAGVDFESPDGERYRARARYVVDASGLNAIVTKKMSTRVPIDELKNIALYGYWQGEHPAPAELGGDIRPTDRNNIIIRWLDDGWTWFIPLGHGDLISVGYVVPQAAVGGGGRAALEELYLERCKGSDEFTYLLSNSTYTGEFHTIKDWSYRTEEMAGPGYFSVGDAACFVDPILSSGVYLAVLYAKMCAIGVNSCLRDADREPMIQDWYQGLYADTYQSYLDVARYWYQGSREVGSWMHQAHESTASDETFAESDRSSFIGLATGNIHAHPNYVLLGEIESLPFPVQLRKDPRGGFHTEAHVALRAHGPGEQHDEGAAVAMQQSRSRKLRVAALMEDTRPVVDRFSNGTAPDDPLPPDATLTLADSSRFTLEVIGDEVALLVAGRTKERRRLNADEQRVLAGLADGGGSPALGPELGGFLAEMVRAGIVEVAPG